MIINCISSHVNKIVYKNATLISNKNFNTPLISGSRGVLSQSLKKLHQLQQKSYLQNASVVAIVAVGTLNPISKDGILYPPQAIVFLCPVYDWVSGSSNAQDSFILEFRAPDRLLRGDISIDKNTDIMKKSNAKATPKITLKKQAELIHKLTDIANADASLWGLLDLIERLNLPLQQEKRLISFIDELSCELRDIMVSLINNQQN